MNSRWEDPCWIAAPENAGKSHVFEKKIHCAGKPVTALLRVSAVGLYRVFVNGRDITAGLLTPGWTDYETRIQYQEYDVKELLQEENTLELLTAGDRSGLANRPKAEPSFHDWDGECGNGAFVSAGDDIALAVYGDFYCPDEKGVKRKTILCRRIRIVRRK